MIDWILRHLVFVFAFLALFAPSTVSAQWRLATFQVEVTPPLGHPCMGGGIKPASRVDDPLFVHGFILLGKTKPIVIAAVDWCEIRNDAYDAWRTSLADAVGTDPARVLVSSIHQHDAPIADLTAQKILDGVKAKGSICDLAFHDKTVRRVAQAARESIAKAVPITHVGIGQAKVENVASNRRFLGPNGRPRFSRTSATRDPAIRAAEEGTVDPWLKTLSFWNGDQPLLALSVYATHPMSYYGRGGISADFVGLARKRRQADDPTVLQIYASGCSGNVTAGKYNDGDPSNRPVLAERIYHAMKAAWLATKKQPLPDASFRVSKLELGARSSRGFRIDDLNTQLRNDAKPFGQCLAALGLSWNERLKSRPTIDVPCLDWGPAALVLLPAEMYVEYQLMAQKLRPDDFIVVLGYGECAPGYVPTQQAEMEGDGNLADWNWVAPGAEEKVRKALADVLTK